MNKTNYTIEPGKQTIEIERIFDAPRDLVFKAMTDPQHVPNWWGPARYDTRVDKMDVRAGGQWRFVQTDAQGNEFGFHGVYHEVNGPDRMTQTFEFEGVPGHVILESMTLEPLPDSKTRMRTLSVFQSVEDRDGMVSTGMQEGSEETYSRLTDLIARLQTA